MSDLRISSCCDVSQDQHPGACQVHYGQAGESSPADTTAECEHIETQSDSNLQLYREGYPSVAAQGEVASRGESADEGVLHTNNTAGRASDKQCTSGIPDVDSDGRRPTAASEPVVNIYSPRGSRKVPWAWEVGPSVGRLRGSGTSLRQRWKAPPLWNHTNFYVRGGASVIAVLVALLGYSACDSSDSRCAPALSL